MSDKSSETRREALLVVAGLALTSMAVTAVGAEGSGNAVAGARDPNGKAGDFEFLSGEWKIQNRRLKSGQSTEWDEFEGEATCWTILSGIGSIEELRIPARNFSGMGLRLLDVEKRIWNDFWVNSKSGVLTTPGQAGNFENNVGTFTADDMDGDKPIKVRGVWDKITPISCRWSQAVSYDQGQTWIENWSMIWTRVK
ncbi:MAG: hypothetical protein JNL58_00390 [Planctomyces sp.]|nr:hypothetical protein [Planctomyces sp.]